MKESSCVIPLPAIAKKHTFKDTFTSVVDVLFKAGIESYLFLFIVILALQLVGKNAVKRMHIEFESITLIQLFVYIIMILMPI